MLMLAVYRLFGGGSNLIASRVMSSIDAPLREMTTPKSGGRGVLAWAPAAMALLLVAVVAAAVAHQVSIKGEQFVLFALSLLAVAGVFFLFAAAVGLVRLREAAIPPDPARFYIEHL